MVGDVDELGGYTNPTYVRHNSIHHSFSRCVTIHGFKFSSKVYKLGTHGLLVQENVAYDHLGHCLYVVVLSRYLNTDSFFEDGIEIRNVLDGNLGLVTKPGTLLPSDR